MKTDQKISVKLKLSTALVKHIALATIISALVFITVFTIYYLGISKDTVAIEGSKTAIAPSIGDIIISEYGAKGHSGNPANEFIELYNNSDAIIDLSYLSLKLYVVDKTGPIQVSTICQLQGTLLPDSFFVIAVKNTNNQPTTALIYDQLCPVGWLLKSKNFVTLLSGTTVFDNAGSLLDYGNDYNYERVDVLVDGSSINDHWVIQNSNSSSPGSANLSDQPQILTVSSSNYTDYGSNGLNEPALKIQSNGSISPGLTQVKIKRGKEHPNKPIGFTIIKRYVEIEPTVQPDNVEMVFYYNDSELNGLTEATLGLFSYYNNSWHSQGGVVDVVNNTITVNSVNHFSEWTAGDGGSALPIELLTFDAEYNGKSIDLSWSTVSEINNDYFTIERSQDAKNYEIVGTVKGAGNSNNTLNYIYNDNTSLTGTVYYKLKQTDFNGKFEYFPPVAVNIASDENSLNISSVGPNPFNNEFNVEFETQSSEPIEVYLYNIRGQMVYKDIYSPTEGKNRYTYNDNKNLPAGYYVIAMKQKDKWAKEIKLLKR